MFDYTLLHWTYFLTACVLIIIVPGPDMAYMLGRTFSGGRSHGLIAMSGVMTGAVLQGTAAFAGLAAVIAASPAALGAIKWAGAAWLVWLGIGALRASASPLAVDRTSAAHGPARIWRDGVLINLLNPKAILFFVAFLPQQVVAGVGPPWAQMALHCVVVWLMGPLIYGAMILAGARLGARIGRSPRVLGLINRAVGFVFVGFGIKLAATRL